MRRPGRSSQRAVTMVEFTLIAPVALLLLMSIVVIGIVVTNYIQMTNVARDGARVAAICGTGLADGSPAEMPDGSGLCSDTAIENYSTNHLVTVPAGSVSPQIFVCTAQDVQSGNCNATHNMGILNCQAKALVEVDMNYSQPLYLPLIANVFQTNSNGTMNLKASAQATCEQ